MKNKNENTELKIKYNKAIYIFEEYLKTLYHQKPGIVHKGYIINLKDLDDLKEKIGYNNKTGQITNMGIVQLKDDEKIYPIEEIKLKTYQYLINMIYNNNTYIIINDILWKVVCKKGKENAPPISYTINSNSITLELDKK